jgi:hypothetical protein
MALTKRELARIDEIARANNNRLDPLALPESDAILVLRYMGGLSQDEAEEAYAISTGQFDSDIVAVE